MISLKTIGVDDEYPALELLKNYCDKNPEIDLISTFSRPEDAFEFVNQNEIDLLILDINMPNINGLELLQKIKKEVLCIFITAEPEHAAKAYELDVIDYLIKPISYKRFEKAITKAKEYSVFKQSKNKNEDYIMFKSDYIINKVSLDDILWIEGFGEYIKIVSRFKTHILLQRLSKFEEDYQHLGFMRIHKSYLILKSHIDTFNSRTVILNNGKELPIGRTYKDSLKFD